MIRKNIEGEISGNIWISVDGMKYQDILESEAGHEKIDGAFDANGCPILAYKKVGAVYSQELFLTIDGTTISIENLHKKLVEFLFRGIESEEIEYIEISLGTSGKDLDIGFSGIQWNRIDNFKQAIEDFFFEGEFKKEV